MKPSLLIGLVVVFNAEATALNSVLYVTNHNPLNLVAAILCGCMFVWSVVTWSRA